MEDQIGAGDDEAEPGQMVPAQRFLQIERGDRGEHREGDDLLQGLELGGGIDLRTQPVGRDGKTLFKGQYSKKAMAQLVRITRSSGADLI